MDVGVVLGCCGSGRDVVLSPSLMELSLIWNCAVLIDLWDCEPWDRSARDRARR